jgi:hypothetical protein
MPRRLPGQPVSPADATIFAWLFAPANVRSPRALRKAILTGTRGSYLVRAPDNPNGVDPKVFDDTRARAAADE